MWAAMYDNILPNHMRRAKDDTRSTFPSQMPVKHGDVNGGVVMREMWSPGAHYGGEVLELAFSADGTHLLTGTRNFAVRVWGVHSGMVELLAPPLVGLVFSDMYGVTGDYSSRLDPCKLIINVR